MAFKGRGEGGGQVQKATANDKLWGLNTIGAIHESDFFSVLVCTSTHRITKVTVKSRV